jgi:hypothetical protein
MSQGHLGLVRLFYSTMGLFIKTAYQASLVDVARSSWSSLVRLLIQRWGFSFRPHMCQASLACGCAKVILILFGEACLFNDGAFYSDRMHARQVLGWFGSEVLILVR